MPIHETTFRPWRITEFPRPGLGARDPWPGHNRPKCFRSRKPIHTCAALLNLKSGRKESAEESAASCRSGEVHACGVERRKRALTRFSLARPWYRAHWSVRIGSPQSSRPSVPSLTCIDSAGKSSVDSVVRRRLYDEKCTSTRYSLFACICFPADAGSARSTRGLCLGPRSFGPRPSGLDSCRCDHEKRGDNTIRAT
jgi:hypothetical protein